MIHKIINDNYLTFIKHGELTPGTIYDFTVYPSDKSDYITKVKNKSLPSFPSVITMFPLDDGVKQYGVNYFSYSELIGWNTEEEDLSDIIALCCSTIMGIEYDISLVDHKNYGHKYMKMDVMSHVCDLVDLWNIINPIFTCAISGRCYHILNDNHIKQMTICIDILTDLLMSSGVNVTHNCHEDNATISSDQLSTYLRLVDGYYGAGCLLGVNSHIKEFIHNNSDRTAKSISLTASGAGHIPSDYLHCVNLVDMSKLTKVTNDIVYRNPYIKDNEAAAKIFYESCERNGGDFYLNNEIEGCRNHSIYECILDGCNAEIDELDMMHAEKCVYWATIKFFIPDHTCDKDWKINFDQISNHDLWSVYKFDQVQIVALYFMWLVNKQDSVRKRQNHIKLSNDCIGFVVNLSSQMSVMCGFRDTGHVINRISPYHINSLYDKILDKYGEVQSSYTLIAGLDRKEFGRVFMSLQNAWINSPNNIINILN